MTEHPVRQLLRAWLPELDFGVMHHGFAAHGRDYVLVFEAACTYEMTLTHVVQLRYETRVQDDVWPRSWDDCLTDNTAWEAAGKPDGYVWGSNWSLAYPGLDTPDDDPLAARWSERLGKPMFCLGLETDRIRLSIVFHGVRTRKLSEDNSTVRRVLIPLAPDRYAPDRMSDGNDGEAAKDSYLRSGESSG